MAGRRQVRQALFALATAALLCFVVALPSATRGITVGPGVVFRPSDSSGNLTFASIQSFSQVQVDATGVTFDSVRFGFEKLPSGLPGMDLDVTTWQPWQTTANATSIAFTGVSSAGSFANFNFSNLVPLWEYDFYVDAVLQGVQFSTLQGNVSFQWSLWSEHSFRIALGGRGAAAPPLSGSFTYIPAEPGVGAPVYFAAAASGGRPPYSFAWTFGDGNTAFGSAAAHTYASARSYVVRLAVSDSTDQLVSLARTLTVLANPPAQSLTADFSYAPSAPKALSAVSFASATGYGTPPYNSSWAFGDGFGAFGPESVHVYGQPGLFNVSLTVTDSGGQQATVVHSLQVSPAPSGARFGNLSVAFSYGVQGTTVSFTDQTSSSAGLPISLHLWTFGDGTRSGEVSPVHTYPAGLLWTTYRAILVDCDPANNCGSTFRDITFVNWIFILAIALLAACAILAIVLVRRRGRRRKGKGSGTPSPRHESAQVADSSAPRRET